MSKCGSCHLEIIWVKAPNGKMMPVDPLPSKFGNIDMLDYADPPNVAFVKPSMAVRYRSHFATCSGAKAYRKVDSAAPGVAATKSKRGKNEPTKREKKAEAERLAYEQAMQGVGG